MKTQVIDLFQPSLSPKNLVLSLGCFDGIHLGHQSLIRQVVLSAKKHLVKSALCVFDPLPSQIIKSQQAFTKLLTIKETQHILRDFDLDYFFIIPFTIPFSKYSPKDFVNDFLKKHFNPIEFIVGYDFFFAHQKQGDFLLLKKLANSASFVAKQIPAYLQDNKPVSSSRIRKCLALSQMQRVKSLLGRPFTIQAPVIRGHSRGTSLGFPTANLQIQNKQLPALGVYAGRVCLSKKSYKAVINLGQQPSFGLNNPIAVEVHILDFNSCLYKQELQVSLEFFLRKELAFSSVLKLQQAIKQDIQQAKILLK